MGGFWRLGAVTRLILCLLLTGWLGVLSKGHLPLQDAVDLTAFAMPDGTLPVLCLDGGGRIMPNRGSALIVLAGR